MCGVAIEVPEMVFYRRIQCQPWNGLMNHHWKGMKETYGSGSAPNPSRQDTRARCEDVNKAPVVRVARARIGAVSSANGAGGLLAGGRVERSIIVAIPRSDSEEDTRIDQGACGGVDRRRETAAQRHVGHGAVGAAACLGVGGHEVHARNDAGARVLLVPRVRKREQDCKTDLVPEPLESRTLTA